MKKRLLKSKAVRQVIVFSMILTLVLAFNPMTASATDYINISEGSAVGCAEFPLGVPTAFGQPQTNTTNYYEFTQIYKKFTVPATSVLTVTIDTPTPSDPLFEPNRLVVTLLNPLGETGTIQTVNKVTDTEVRSNAVNQNSKTVQYKVLAGTYYIKANQWQNNYNGYGTITVTATPVTTDDPEPNDTKILAKAVNLNTPYTGAIAYWGKLTANGDGYTEDWYDYFAITVPKNNYGLRVTFSRTNDATEKNLAASLQKADGGSIGETINLKTQFSATKDYNIETAGTYYFYVNGYGMSNGDCTEYSFRIDGTEPTTITMKTSASVYKGKTLKLAPAVLPKEPVRTLTWKSSDTSVATVSTEGVVKGVKVGTATITATVNGVSNVYASCSVSVLQPVTKVSLNKKTLKLKKGKKYMLIAKLSPAGVSVSYKKVKWSSSNKKIVKVSSKGKVTALKKGTATITVKTHNGKTAKCKIRVV
jgi:uncharacterized protein YjdB